MRPQALFPAADHLTNTHSCKNSNHRPSPPPLQGSGSQFAIPPQTPPLIPLDQHPAIRIRIKSQLVQRVQLTRPEEHVLIHLPIIAPQTAVELPIGESPRIYQASGVRSDLFEKRHDGLGPGELDLANRGSGTGEELRGFALEGVESIETKQLMEKRDGLGA